MSRPSWDEYFIRIAEDVAGRSTCLRRKVGAVLVRDKRILTTGYNGAPRGVEHCESRGCLRDEMNVPSVNRNANVATTLTQNKAKPQSPKPPAARIHESPKRAGTGREEMIKSIQLTMKPQKNLTETNGNGDNDDADAWE